jgi:Zn-dependent protease with chaperone function
MNISYFFNSYSGMYIVQSFWHSLIAAVLVDSAIRIWRINNSSASQRLRFLVLICPIVSFPLYQAINPDRGSLFFRLGALFDSNRVMNLELWGRIPLSLGVILLICITTFIVMIQEIIPIVWHTIESRQSDSEGKIPGEDSPVKQALEDLPGEKPDVVIVEDDEPVLFSTTGRKTAIFLSSGMLEVLSVEQLQAAIAHEIAHIIRNRRPVLIITFLLRLLMFYNPIVLFEFRKIVQEEEHICDDMAVSLTRKPHALAETLKKLYYEPEQRNLVNLREFSKLKDSIEEYGHNMHIEGRIMRLEGGGGPRTGSAWFAFMLTLLAIIVMNYFIV